MKHQKEIHFIKNPLLPAVEAKISIHNGEVVNNHIHDTYSIGFVIDGGGVYYSRNKNIDLAPETVVLNNPDEVHSNNSKRDRLLSCVVFYFDMKWFKSLFDLDTDRYPYFNCPFTKKYGLSKPLNLFFYFIQNSDNQMEVESQACSLASFYMQHFSETKRFHKFTQANSKIIDTVQEYLLAHLTENISLNELSSISGLSPYHLLRSFKNKVGLPPHTFQIQKRINLSQTLLSQGQSIAEVAVETGFTDQSHFTKHFKKWVGVTPNRYQMATG